MEKLSIFLMLFTLSTDYVICSRHFTVGVLAVEEPLIICCLKGFRAFDIEEQLDLRMVRTWGDFASLLEEEEEQTRNSLLILHHVNEDFLLAAVYVYNTLRPKNGSVVWLPKTPDVAANISFAKYQFILAELINGSFESAGDRLTGQMFHNPNTIAYLSEIVSILVAVGVFVSGVCLRYTRQIELIDTHMKTRNTSKVKKMTRDEALVKLGNWGGISISYSAGVVLLGLQEVCIMLMTIYYFHWLSHLLKLAFIVAFVTSADMLYEDFFEDGPNFFELPYLGKVNTRRTIFRCFCLAMGIVWVCTRKESWTWILHNIMASVICISLIADTSLPSMATICFFAVLLAVYDLFMVFITPRFTADGVSVMESAVLGVDGEVMPMVMYTPKFPSMTKYPQCAPRSVGFLGLGDIIIPGIIGSYCATFDAFRLRESRLKLYHLAILSYLLGLITTYLFREWMDSAQPALIYIIPIMLLMLLSGAYLMCIFKDFWQGNLRNLPKKNKSK